MASLAPQEVQSHPALRRLAAISPLDDLAKQLVLDAARHVRALKPNRELIREGAPIRDNLLMLSGWGARVRHFEDGRRQIMSFLLPGDLIGNCRQSSPLAVSSVVSLTQIEYCTAPNTEMSASLTECYAVSHAMEEAYLLAQIARLGRMSAEERLADLMLELLNRLAQAGLTKRNSFTFPLTQEVLADAVGLSNVHINRTIQALRREGDIVFRANTFTLPDPEQLARRVGQNPVRVTEGAPARDKTQGSA